MLFYSMSISGTNTCIYPNYRSGTPVRRLSNSIIRIRPSLYIWEARTKNSGNIRMNMRFSSSGCWIGKATTSCLSGTKRQHQTHPICRGSPYRSSDQSDARTTIEGFINTIANVDLIITIDSSALHIAAAVKTPFIALMGLSTSPTSTILPKVPLGRILKIENNLIREEDYIRNITPDLILKTISELI